MYIHTLKTDGVQVILLAPNQVSPTPMSTSFQVDIKPENPLSAEVELGVTSLAPPQSYWPRLCQQSNTKGTLRCSPLGLSLSALLHTPPPHTDHIHTSIHEPPELSRRQAVEKSNVWEVQPASIKRE